MIVRSDMFEAGEQWTRLLNAANPNAEDVALY